MNIAFFGSPHIAATILEAVHKRFPVSLVVTQPDKQVGRKQTLTPTPVKLFSTRSAIHTVTNTSINRFIEVLRKKKIDLAVVVAYGEIISKELLDVPKFGFINVHYSLLPKYRGASPVESVILNGDVETGVTIQQMEYKMDAGTIIAQEKVSIFPDEKALNLRKRLIKIGGELLVKILPDIMEGKIKTVPQNGSLASVCKKIKKEDGLIDLNGDPVKNYNKFRAYAVWPRTFFFKNGKRIIITKAKLENNKFVIEKVILEGGKETDYKVNTSK